MVTLRLASEDEADAVASVLRRAFEPLSHLYTPEAIAYTIGTEASARVRISEGPVWLAFDGASPVGTASVLMRRDRLYLRGMAVTQEARGMGVGAKLLGAAIDYGIEEQARSIYLHTTPFLESAIRLYERHGFQRTDEGPHDLFGTPLFAMEAPLEAP